MLKKVLFLLEVADAICFVLNNDTLGSIVTILCIVVMFLDAKQPITLDISDDVEYVMAN